MSEEEKEAIEQLKSCREYIINHRDSVNKANDIEFYLGTALNLIDKQQKEIEELKQVIQSKNKEIKLMKNTNLVEEHDKALKVIDKMANWIENRTLGWCKEQIIEQFYKEIENE